MSEVTVILTRNRLYSPGKKTVKNMINLVVWQYQESETNKCREPRLEKKKYKTLGFLALPKTKLLVAKCTSYLFFI